MKILEQILKFNELLDSLLIARKQNNKKQQEEILEQLRSITR